MHVLNGDCYYVILKLKNSFTLLAGCKKQLLHEALFRGAILLSALSPESGNVSTLFCILRRVTFI